MIQQVKGNFQSHMLSCQLYVHIILYPMCQSFVGSSVHQQAEVLYGINRFWQLLCKTKKKLGQVTEK